MSHDNQVLHWLYRSSGVETANQSEELIQVHSHHLFFLFFLLFPLLSLSTLFLFFFFFPLPSLPFLHTSFLSHFLPYPPSWDATLCPPPITATSVSALQPTGIHSIVQRTVSSSRICVYSVAHDMMLHGIRMVCKWWHPFLLWGVHYSNVLIF